MHTLLTVKGASFVGLRKGTYTGYDKARQLERESKELAYTAAVASLRGSASARGSAA